MERLFSKFFFGLSVLLGMASCSVTKFVPQDSYLLDRVEVSGLQNDVIQYQSLQKYSYQTPNSRWLGLVRVPLGIYSLSSKRNPDGRFSSLLRKMGQAPVVYDELMALASAQDMTKALVNQGFLNASVIPSVEKSDARRARLKYSVSAGRQFVIDSIATIVPDQVFAQILKENSASCLIAAGMPLNSSVLDEERSRIVDIAHRNAYFDFNRDHVSFVADTLAGSDRVNLRMIVDRQGIGQRYAISKVNYRLMDGGEHASDSDGSMEKCLDLDGYSIYFPATQSRPALNPDVISGHSNLRKGQEYNSDATSLSYQSLSRLGILKYSNIAFQRDDSTAGGLVANVSMMTRPKHSYGLEIEGTNTAGDLGAAASMSFVDRNLFHGSEQLSVKLRGAYESISNLPGYTGDTYLEYGAEASLSFPEFLMPFIGPDRQRMSRANSEFSLKVNAQKRPEFQKTIFSAGWSYVWGDVWNNSHRFDVIDLNYLVVPWISSHFQTEYLDQITSSKSILRYNYEDLLITKIGYTFYRTNSGQSKSAQNKPFQYSVRAGVETSGNVIDLLAPALDLETNEFGQSMVMGIAFAQYFKHDFSFTANWKAGAHGNLLFHTEWGIGVPYGNSTTLPFEKRYFAGGANGVRGWSVRGLGPGVYSGEDGSIDYIHQSGDIKLGCSLEYRSHIFWKLNGAAFVDAGNIWTIREYAEQPGGLFKFDEFYRQIAVSYGLGVRLDFNFLVVRFDGGMKAFNPAGESEREKLPLAHPDFERDFAFHLAVGYPF